MHRIAYLTSKYPAVSHTFIQREILTLRESGVAVETFSIRKPRSTDPRSETDKAEYAATFYILPPRPLRLLLAHLVAFVTRPVAYGRALFHAVTVRPPGLQALVWQLFYFAEGVCLWHEMRRRDIAHVHVHFAMACATVAMIAAQLGDVTYSMTVHGPTVFYDAARYRIREKVQRAVMVSCISEFCRSQVMALARPEDWPKLIVVHCGIDPDQYAAQDRARQGESAVIRLLNVGRLSAVKGHAILLEAMAELRGRQYDVACTIIGDGPERARLESLSRELGIREHVRFAGSVDQDAIQPFFEEASIFVLPSFAEGVPVVLMEAMAKGLPVISTRIMGIPELVEHGENGLLIPPGRVEPLTEAITMLAKDAGLRERMGARGREKVCREFDVRLAAELYSQVFSRIGSGRPVPMPQVSDGATDAAAG